MRPLSRSPAEALEPGAPRRPTRCCRRGGGGSRGRRRSGRAAPRCRRLAPRTPGRSRHAVAWARRAACRAVVAGAGAGGGARSGNSRRSFWFEHRHLELHRLGQHREVVDAVPPGLFGGGQDVERAVVEDAADPALRQASVVDLLQARVAHLLLRIPSRLMTRRVVIRYSWLRQAQIMMAEVGQRDDQQRPATTIVHAAPRSSRGRWSVAPDQDRQHQDGDHHEQPGLARRSPASADGSRRRPPRRGSGGSSRNDIGRVLRLRLSGAPAHRPRAGARRSGACRAGWC